MEVLEIMEVKDTLVVSTEFSNRLGARYKKDGDNSGEEFLEKLLKPKVTKAIEGDYILKIVLDNVLGYPSSFVSGSFGKLSLEIGAKKLLDHLEFVSDDNPVRKDKVIFEIQNPKKKS